MIQFIDCQRKFLPTPKLFFVCVKRSTAGLGSGSCGHPGFWPSTQDQVYCWSLHRTVKATATWAPCMACVFLWLWQFVKLKQFGLLWESLALDAWSSPGKPLHRRRCVKVARPEPCDLWFSYMLEFISAALLVLISSTGAKLSQAELQLRLTR